MALIQEKEDEYYTYADYLEWDEDPLTELYDGKVVMMSPPLSRHQKVSMELSYQIRSFLEGKPCKVFAAPFGVRLFPKKDKRDDTIFLPDITVVCDEKKLDKNGCNGAPDLIIEIISPSSAKYDRIYKLRKYQQAGVKEYWIVDPEIKSVIVLILENGQYITAAYDETEKIPVTVLKGCEINLQAIFAE